MLDCYKNKSRIRADQEKWHNLFLCPARKPYGFASMAKICLLLHKYTRDYADFLRPLYSLLKKDATWSWRPEHQAALDAGKKILASVLMLVLPDDINPFHVLCNVEILHLVFPMKFNDEDRERVVRYQ